MRRPIGKSLLTMLFLGVLPGVSDAGTVRISQIYTNGGLSLAPYNSDYIELFNSGATAIDIGGWLLAYGGASTTSSYGCSNCTQTFPVGTTIDGCGYLLVRVGPISMTTGAPVPSPDVEFAAPNLRAFGSLMLIRSGNPQGHCPVLPETEDLLGWATSCHEGFPALGISDRGNQALHRLNAGFIDSNDNWTDFYLAAATPRSGASPKNPTCLSTSAIQSSWGRVKAIHR